MHLKLKTLKKTKFKNNSIYIYRAPILHSNILSYFKPKYIWDME